MITIQRHIAYRALQSNPIMTKATRLKEHFQVGHLYEYEMNKLSQVKENGGIIKKTLLLKKVDIKQGSLYFDNIQNGDVEVFYYEEYNIDTLKKIS